MKRKRESDKETRERSKRDEAINRESKKLIIRSTKETKEETKKRKGEMHDKNKVRAQYRKDFSSDLKRIRGDANVSVLQYFDEEENLEEQDQHIRHAVTATSTGSRAGAADGEGTGAVKGSGKGVGVGVKAGVVDRIAAGQAGMEDLLRSLPSCDRAFLTPASSSSTPTSSSSALIVNTANAHSSSVMNSGSGSNRVDGGFLNGDATVHNGGQRGSGSHLDTNSSCDVNWDDVFQTVNCLYAFNDFLQLQMPIRLDGVIAKIARVTSALSDKLVSGSHSSGGSSVGKGSKMHINASSIHHDTTTSLSEKGEKEKEKEIKASVANEIVPSSSTSTITIAKKSNHDVEGEDEWDEVDFSKSNKINDTMDLGSEDGINEELEGNDLAGLLDAQADLDRIHLCLVNSLTSDLHSLLDLDETEKGSAVKFPQNQVRFNRFVLF